MKKFFQIEIPQNRNFGLDLLRFFAIFFVLIGHGVNQLPDSLKYINQYFYLDGVSLFFVLSGFLIGGIFIKFYEKEKLNKNILNFWIRRWMRTIPAYYFILILVCTAEFIITRELNIVKTIKHFLFIQNFTAFDPYLYPEAWSLSIEEWFYLLLPILSLIFFAFFHNKKRAFLLVILTVVTITPIIRLYFFDTHPITNGISEWDETFRSVTILRLDSIMFGVLAAYLKRYFSTTFFHAKTLKFISGIALLIVLRTIDLIFDYSSLFQCVFSFTLNSLGVFLLLPYLFCLKQPKNRAIIKIITFTSLISYSLYLVNSTLIQSLFLNHIHIEKSLFIKYAAYWILSFSAATFTYKFVELPFMRIRDKHFK